jgi:hypothetical protein
MPARAELSMYASITRPFSTAMPASANHATDALRLRLSPRNHNAAIPPIKRERHGEHDQQGVTHGAETSVQQDADQQQIPGTMAAAVRCTLLVGELDRRTSRNTPAGNLTCASMAPLYLLHETPEIATAHVALHDHVALVPFS